MAIREAHLLGLVALVSVLSLPAAQVRGDTPSTGFELLKEDLAAGVITIDDYVLFGVQAMITPISPDRYVPLGLEGDLAVMEFLAHWDEVSSATQAEVLSLFESVHQGSFFPTADSVDPEVLAAAADQCVGFELFDILVRVVCTHVTDHFEVRYTVIGPSGVPLDDSDADGVPDYVGNIGANLEDSWSLYLDLGFRAPDELPVQVTIQGPPMLPGSGVVPPNQHIILSNVDGDQYLPRHELLHVLQWEYGGETMLDRSTWFTRTGTDWWMEATAEWAAHLASPDGVLQADQYAVRLPDFLGFPDRALHAHAFINGPSGQPQYGAFIFAEFIEERLGGDLIRASFERTTEVDQPGALAAIDTVIAANGSSLGAELFNFTRQAYLMDFQDEDVGVWRNILAGDQRNRTVADDLGDARPYRARETLILGETSSGELVLEPGGRWYIDLVAAGDDPGLFQIEIEGDAAGLAAEVLSFSDYPTYCQPPELFPIGVAEAPLQIPIDPNCRHATLAMTHLDPVGGANRTVSWDVTFSPVELVLAHLRSGDVSDGVSVSGDGRFVAAVVYGDADPSVQDILVVDTSDDSDVRISGLNSTGENGAIEFPKITTDGARVVAPINEGSTRRVVWWDRLGSAFGAPSLVPAPTANQPADRASISDDGNRIAFWSRDSVANGMMAVYQVDTDTTTLIDLASIGLTADGEIRPGYISGDGNTVVFPARSDAFQPPWQIYAYDLVDDSYTVVSVDGTGAPNSEDSLLPDHMSPVSDDGQFVVFKTWSGGVYLADRDSDGNGVLDDTSVVTTQLPATDVFSHELSGNGSYLGYVTFSDDQIRRVDIASDQDTLVEAETSDTPHSAAVDDAGRVYYTICDWNHPYPWPCTLYRAP